MGGFNGMPKVTGLEHFLAPFVAAVIGDRELVHWLLVHHECVAEIVMAQRSPGDKVLVWISSATSRCGAAAPAIRPRH